MGKLFRYRPRNDIDIETNGEGIKIRREEVARNIKINVNNDSGLNRTRGELLKLVICRTYPKKG